MGPDDETNGDETSHPGVDALPWASLAEPSDAGLLADLDHARLRASILGEDYEPPLVGRFALLRKLGQGGMGSVYAAYDDQLDRKVALKFLHPDQAHDERAIHRLLREAQALARLSHPNLVPVFDVGRIEDQVYLAMELVPGTTIRAWAESKPRSWREILPRWIEVGHALVAVHAAGMVHRDIKPDNVMVGDDGRTRLVDFGLARGQEAQRTSDPLETTLPAHDDDGLESSRSSGGGPRLAVRITQTRAVVGTPAYMAPEVRWGEPADEASDQYSLCLSLYESLFGERPPGPTEDGALIAIPATARMPPALRRVLSRGLAMDRCERFSSMAAVVDALERILGRRRLRQWVAGAALVGAMGFGTLLARSTEPALPAPCAAVRDDLAEVWGEEERRAIRESIAATALPYASPLAEHVEHQLDEHASAWREARVRVCEATRVQQTQSDTLLDRRMACLDRQRDRFAALIDAAVRADPVTTPQLPSSLTLLDAPEDCELDTLARSEVDPPSPELRLEVETIHGVIARLRVNAVLQGPRPTLDDARDVHDQALRLDHDPLTAEAELMLGHLHLLADDPAARAHLDQAAALAEAMGDDLLKEEALRLTCRIVAELDPDPEHLARAWMRNEATLTRLREPPLRMARSKQTVAMLQLRAGDPAGAAQTHREEIELWHAAGGVFTAKEATAWRSLAQVLVGLGRIEPARAAFDRAAAIEDRWGGAMLDRGIGATRLGKVELVGGDLALREGQLDEALERFTAALDVTVEAYGATSVPAGRVHMALSDLANRQGQLDEALEHARAADANFRRWLGDSHMLRAWPLSSRGTIATYRGQADAAVEAFAEALGLQESVLPPGHTALAIARSNYGEALVLAGRHEEATQPLRAALDRLERHLDPDDVTLSYPLHALAEASLARGRADEACDYAQRALALRARHADNPVELARTHWVRARCLAALGRQPEARSEALEAREGLSGSGRSQDFAHDLAAVDAFLSRR